MSFFDERQEARAEGRVEVCVELYRQGALSLEVAVKNSKLSKEEFLALVNETDSQPQN